MEGLQQRLADARVKGRIAEEGAAPAEDGGEALAVAAGALEGAQERAAELAARLRLSHAAPGGGGKAGAEGGAEGLATVCARAGVLAGVLEALAEGAEGAQAALDAKLGALEGRTAELEQERGKLQVCLACHAPKPSFYPGSTAPRNRADDTISLKH